MDKAGNAADADKHPSGNMILTEDGSLKIVESGFQEVIALLPVAAFLCNSQGVITGYNRNAALIWGHAIALEESVKHSCGSCPVLTMRGSPIVADCCPMMRAIKTGQEYLSEEVSVRRSDGSHISALLSAKPLFDNAGRTLSAIGVLVDIHAEKNARSLLQSEIKEYRRVEQRIHESNEREQSRLVNYLHEDLAQQLTGIAMLIGVFHRHLRGQSPELTSKVIELSKMASEAIGAAANLAKAFYPVDIDDGGLIAALEYLAQKTEARARIPCALSHEDSFIYEPAKSIHLYRIVQGVVSGIIKHARPEKIGLKCKTEAGYSKLVITYTCHSPSLRDADNVIDLDLVKSRARLIGADLQIKKTDTGGEFSVTFDADAERRVE